ncbi:MAG: hypothetical protein JXR88_10520 [Clostridia bacterium]|nr:hypothetical protein [Clostridia bacterium]
MKKNLFMIGYLGSPVLLSALIYSQNFNKYGTLLSLFSLFLGVSAFVWIQWQFIIASRPKWLERKIGMDFLLRFHGIMALLIIFSGFFHGQIKEMYFRESFMTQLGSLALLVMGGTSAISILFMVTTKFHHIPILSKVLKPFRNSKLLSYENLRKLHNFMFVVMLLSVVHVLMSLKTEQNVIVLSAYMLPFLLGLMHYIYHKLIKNWMLIEKPLKVVGFKKYEGMNNQNVWRLQMSSEQPISYKPGQFGYFRFYNKGKYEEHPFSLLSAPQDEHLEVAMKSLGDFTKNIEKDMFKHEIYMDGPYGNFTFKHHSKEKKLVFIAAGIGITPMLSMLKDLVNEQSSQEIILIWQLKDLDEAYFLGEITEMAKILKGLKIFMYLSQNENLPLNTNAVTYVKGRVNLEVLFSNDSNKMDSGYYICGPAMFMEASKKSLLELRIKRSRIHIEKFSF